MIPEKLRTSEIELAARIRGLSEEMQPQSTGEEPRLPALQGIKAVLFDVYGTLVISGSGDIGALEETHSGQAMARALSAAGFTGLSDETGGRGVALYLQGISRAHEKLRKQGIECPEVEIRMIWREVVSALQEESLIGGVLSQGIIERLAVEYECRVNPTWPMPSVQPMLEELRNQHMALGIVSNAQFYTRLVFEAHLGGLPEAIGFDPTFCVYSYNFWQAKPSPILFDKAVGGVRGEAGIKPEETLYVGNDMLNDIWAASRVGFRTALFAGDQRSLRLRSDDPRCAKVKPDAVVTDLGQLVGLLR